MGRVTLPDGRVAEVVRKPNRGKQTLWMSSPARESLFGGAVYGGKTEGLILMPLRWVAHPQHRAILFRRQRDDVREIIDRAREIYDLVCPRSVTWVESRFRFEFASGSFIAMGHCERDEDVEKYKSFEFNWVGFDELTTFSRHQYVYMLSRNRSKNGALPLHVRSGTNPDGPGHEWVVKRLVEGREDGVIYRRTTTLVGPTGRPLSVSTTQQFIQATIWDNPKATNRDEYVAGLLSMGTQLAEALLNGKWNYFRGQMFPYGPNGGLTEVEPGVKGPHYVVRCLDYGWTQPTALLTLVVYPDLDGHGLTVEVANELSVTETSVAAIASMQRAAEERLLDAGCRLPPTFSVADPSIAKTEGTSEKSLMTMFLKNGLWFQLANNDRQSGWAQLRQWLEEGRIRVWRGRAPHLYATLGKLIRDPGKGDDLLQKPKQRDHWADALRYGCMAVSENMDMGVAEEPQLRPGQDPYYDQLMASLRQPDRGTTLDLLGQGWG